MTAAHILPQALLRLARLRALPGALTTAAVLAVSLVLTAPTVWAASSASSASLEGASASVGSLSTSVETSSNSSTGGDRKAAGPYRVEQVAVAADRPGHVRIALVPADAAAYPEARAMALVVPEATAKTARLQRGDVVVVAERDFGLAFSRSDQAGAFFVALADGHARELRTRAVGG
jgi:hypothetical protein